MTKRILNGIVCFIIGCNWGRTMDGWRCYRCDFFISDWFFEEH